MAVAPHVLLFGDSLTAFGFKENGWIAAVSRAYRGRADVLSRGYSG